MTAFNENNLNDPNESLRNLRQGENTSTATLESDNPYTEAENPAGVANFNATMGNKLDRDEGYGENSGILNANSISNSDISPGPGEDDDLDDDDDLLDDDDDDTLIPIEGDEEDDLLSADDDDDVIPGTDMDDGDDLLDDDDDLNDDDDDSGVNRSTTGDIGTNISGRNDGRTTGRMIDHEPGTGGI